MRTHRRVRLEGHQIVDEGAVDVVLAVGGVAARGRLRQRDKVESPIGGKIIREEIHEYVLDGGEGGEGLAHLGGGDIEGERRRDGLAEGEREVAAVRHTLQELHLDVVVVGAGVVAARTIQE